MLCKALVVEYSMHWDYPALIQVHPVQQWEWSHYPGIRGEYSTFVMVQKIFMITRIKTETAKELTLLVNIPFY